MSDDVCRRTPEIDELNRIARLLISEWERVERKPVNVSYVATFVDLARAVIADRAASTHAPAVDRAPQSCDHGVSFDPRAAKGLSASEIEQRWPRLYGACPKGCGFDGISYASALHYLSGDW